MVGSSPKLMFLLVLIAMGMPSLARAFSFGDIGNAFNDAGNAIKDTAVNAGNTVKDTAVNAGNTIKDTAVNAGNTIKDTAVNAGNTIKDTAVNAGNTIKDTAEKLVPNPCAVGTWGTPDFINYYRCNGWTQNTGYPALSNYPYSDGEKFGTNGAIKGLTDNCSLPSPALLDAVYPASVVHALGPPCAMHDACWLCAGKITDPTGGLPEPGVYRSQKNFQYCNQKLYQGWDNVCKNLTWYHYVEGVAASCAVVDAAWTRAFAAFVSNMPASFDAGWTHDRNFPNEPQQCPNNNEMQQKTYQPWIPLTYYLNASEVGGPWSSTCDSAALNSSSTHIDGTNCYTGSLQEHCRNLTANCRGLDGASYNSTLDITYCDGYLFNNINVNNANGQLTCKSYLNGGSDTDQKKLNLVIKGGNQGMYCSDQSDRFKCNINSVGPWETFSIQPTSDGKYTIKGNRAGKFCSDDPKGMMCNRDSVGAWEKFGITPLGNNRYSIKGGRNNQYCSDDPNTGYLCNKNSVQAWEMFQIPGFPGGDRPRNHWNCYAPGYVGDVTIKGGNQGMYCSDQNDRFRCNVNSAGAWEVFSIQRTPDGKYAFRGNRAGKFCSDDQQGIACNRDSVGAWEKFDITSLGNNRYSIKGGRNNQYCSDDPGAYLCNRNSVQAWEQFQIQGLNNLSATELYVGDVNISSGFSQGDGTRACNSSISACRGYCTAR